MRRTTSDKERPSKAPPGPTGLTDQYIKQVRCFKGSAAIAAANCQCQPMSHGYHIYIRNSTLCTMFGLQACRTFDVTGAVKLVARNIGACL